MLPERFAVVQSPVDGDTRIVLEIVASDCRPWSVVACGTREAMEAVQRLCEPDYRPQPTERHDIATGRRVWD